MIHRIEEIPLRGPVRCRKEKASWKLTREKGKAKENPNPNQITENPFVAPARGS